MHAVIKIMSFLVFGAAVSTGNNQILLAGVLLVVPLYLFEGKAHLKGMMVMLKRLKWLFVSILVVYLFFTPGQLLWPDVYWGPTVEGLLQGTIRVGALVLLVAAVNLLISSTEQNDFLSAIMWCLRPLSVFGLPHERLAVRITLTLDAVSQIRRDYRADFQSNSLSNNQSKNQSDSPEQGGVQNETKKELRLSAISETANRLFQSVIANAESAPVREIELPEESCPPVIQWLIPLALAGLFAVIKYMSLNEYL